MLKYVLAATFFLKDRNNMLPCDHESGEGNEGSREIYPKSKNGDIYPKMSKMNQPAWYFHTVLCHL